MSESLYSLPEQYILSSCCLCRMKVWIDAKVSTPLTNHLIGTLQMIMITNLNKESINVDPLLLE